MVDARGALARPFSSGPSKPLVAALGEHKQRLVTQLRKFRSPAGSAFYRIVFENFPDNVDFLAAVDLVPDALQDFSHQRSVVIPAIHQPADVFQTDIALFQLFVGEHADTARSRVCMPHEGIVHFVDAIALRCCSEGRLGSVGGATKQDTFFRLHYLLPADSIRGTLHGFASLYWRPAWRRPRRSTT